MDYIQTMTNLSGLCDKVDNEAKKKYAPLYSSQKEVIMHTIERRAKALTNQNINCEDPVFPKVPPSNAVDRLAAESSPITLPINLKQKIQSWKLPWEFLKQCTGAPETVYQSLLAKTCYVLRTFNDSVPLRDPRRPVLHVEDRIQFRICAVLWYILFKQCWLGLNRGSNSGESTVHYTSIILEKIVNNSEILPPRESVSANEIRDWVRKGERYHLLTVDLGGVGILFLLPDKTEYLCVSLRAS
jgi:hypothetical protein